MAEGNSVAQDHSNKTESQKEEKRLKKIQRILLRRRNPFRTVLFSPLPQNVKEDELLSYFQAFGEIDRVSDIVKKESFSIGAVEFLYAESVFNILSERNHQFGGGDVNVWANINEPNLAEILLRGRLYQPENEGASILSLNDDCLIEIFSYLPPLDLISVFDTCLRFRTVAPLAFASTHRIVDFGRLNSDSKVEKFRKVLRNFGSCITELTLGGCFWRLFVQGSEENITAIADHCIGSMKSINLCRFRIVDETDESFVPKMQALFGNLEAIILKNCTINSSILSACKQLVHLEIDNFDGLTFEYCYPQLKTFIFTETDSENALLPSESFFKNHPNLEKIVIKRRTRHNPGVRMLNSLINYAGESLHSLQLKGVAIEEDMVPRLREIFNKLKYLKLCDFGERFSLNLFSNKTQLKEIDIGSIRQTNAFETVFPNLEMIKFDLREENVDDEILIKFFRNQKNLTEICTSIICKGWPTDILAFIVNDFKQLEKLNLDFYGDECTYKTCINQLTNLKHLKKLILRFDMFIHEKTYRNFISDTVYKDTLEYLEMCSHDIDCNLIDSIAQFPKLRQLNLYGYASHDVPGGPYTILKYLLTKLWYVSYVNITHQNRLLLENKAYDELMEIAHRNKQKFNIFKDGYMSNKYMFEMEIDTTAFGKVN